MNKVVQKIRIGFLILFTCAAIAMFVGDFLSFLLDPSDREIEKLLITQSESIEFPDYYQQIRRIYSDRGGIHSLRLIYKSTYPIIEDELIKPLHEGGFPIKRRRVVSTIKYTRNIIVLENERYACVVTIMDEQNFDMIFYYKTPIERAFGARY